ncbi:MAG: hypothetical protein WC475_03125 [Candidatus Paceibacterota bacterium]
MNEILENLLGLGTSIYGLNYVTGKKGAEGKENIKYAVIGAAIFYYLGPLAMEKIKVSLETKDSKVLEQVVCAAVAAGLGPGIIDKVKGMFSKKTE